MKPWLCDTFDIFCSVTEGSENYSHSAPEIHDGNAFVCFLIICIGILLITQKKRA